MNFNNLLQQAQNLQKKIQEKQENLKIIEVSGESGGGMVKAIMNGESKLKKIQIDDSLLIKEEKDVLEDLIVAAVNKAKENIDSTVNGEMNNIATELNLPKNFKMPF